MRRLLHPSYPQLIQTFLTVLMARDTRSSIKKVAAPKPRAQQTVASTRASSTRASSTRASSAQNAGHIAPGEENHPPVADTASATPQVSTLAPVLAQPAVPGDPVPDVVRDLSPDAATEIVALKGEYSTCLMHTY